MQFNKNDSNNNNLIYAKKNVLILILILLLFLLKDFAKSSLYNYIYQKLQENDFLNKENKNCNKYDPVFLMAERFKKYPVTICNNEESNHICYQNSKFSYYNRISRIKYGVICLSHDFILDPSKSNQSNYIYKGPIDKLNRGSPILFKGFFNMKCQIKNRFKKNHMIYNNYFQAWNYSSEINDKDIKELAPGKTIFFISRNQDSPNIYHGISEIINAISIMYLLDLNPEDIQVVFLESMELKNDPFFDLYKLIISRGGEPIHIKSLNKKYHITSAIHIPINWDSPLFIELNIPNGYPVCKYSTQTYNLLNNLINKYIIIPAFKDSFVSDKETFYYPKSAIQNFKLNNCFNKTITIQWRKVWPKGRKFQYRILGNGPELADKLSSMIPKNYLIRLVDTASLSIIQQISIMRKTDYLIGVHGAGLSLSIFMPPQSVLYEILPKKNIKVLVLMSALSGHKIYSDIVKSTRKIINDNEVYYFDLNDFEEKVIKHLKEKGF